MTVEDNTQYDAKDVPLPLFSKGWLVASVVFGLSVGVLFFVFVGVVYFPGSVHSDRSRTLIVLDVALAIAGLMALLGLSCHVRYRRAKKLTGADQRRAILRLVAIQRRVAAGLLAFFGGCAVWHGFAHSTWLGGAVLCLVGLEFTAGRRFMAELRKFSPVVGMVGVIATIALVVTTMIVVTTSDPFFLLLSLITSTFTVPYVPQMLTEARAATSSSRST